VVGIRHLGLCP